MSVMYASMVYCIRYMAIDDHSVRNMDFVVISRNVSPSALDACAKDNQTLFGFFSSKVSCLSHMKAHLYQIA